MVKYGCSGVEKKGVNGFGAMFCLMRLLIKTLKHMYCIGKMILYWGMLMEEHSPTKWSIPTTHRKNSPLVILGVQMPRQAVGVSRLLNINTPLVMQNFTYCTKDGLYAKCHRNSYSGIMNQPMGWQMRSEWCFLMLVKPTE